MELSAYIINNIFLLLYAILGGIDFGVGILFLVFLFKKLDTNFSSRIFNPVWEVNHVFLIFYIITFWVFFPKAITFFSPILFIPSFLGLFFLLIRSGAYIFINFINKDSHNAKIAMGISSLFAPICFSSVILLMFKDYRISLNFLYPNITNIMFYLLVITTCTILGSSYLYIFTRMYKKEDLNKFLAKFIYYLGLLWLIELIFFDFVFLNRTNLVTNTFVYMILSLAFLLYIFIGIKALKQSYIFSFFVFVSSTAGILINIIFLKFPYLSQYGNINIYDAFTTPQLYKYMIILIVLCLLITLPSVFLFYKLYLGDFIKIENQHGEY